MIKKNYEFEKIKDIADALDVKISDLFLVAEGVNVKSGPDLYRVPLISWVQAGNLKEVFINNDFFIAFGLFAPLWLFRPILKALEIFSDLVFHSRFSTQLFCLFPSM